MILFVGGGGRPGSNPPCAGSRHHGLLPGLLVIACYLSFTPSSLKSFPSNQQPNELQCHAVSLTSVEQQEKDIEQCGDVHEEDTTSAERRTQLN